MNKVLKIFILCLLFFPATTWGQSHLVPGTAVEEPLKKHHHDRPVNFGIKGGFTSSLFLVSNLTLNGITIDEVSNRDQAEAFRISEWTSKVNVLVIKTNEELEIAREAAEVARNC